MLHRLAAYTRKSGNESPPKRRATADLHASALAHSIPPRSPTSHIGFCNPASISGTSRADFAVSHHGR